MPQALLPLPLIAHGNRGQPPWRSHISEAGSSAECPAQLAAARADIPIKLPPALPALAGSPRRPRKSRWRCCRRDCSLDYLRSRLGDGGSAITAGVPRVGDASSFLRFVRAAPTDLAAQLGILPTERVGQALSLGQAFVAIRPGASGAGTTYECRAVTLRGRGARRLALIAASIPLRLLPRACTHKRTAKMLTWMCRPTSVIGGKADTARTCQYVR
jgi:hypothetical protein